MVKLEDAVDMVPPRPAPLSRLGDLSKCRPGEGTERFRASMGGLLWGTLLPLGGAYENDHSLPGDCRDPVTRPMDPIALLVSE